MLSICGPLLTCACVHCQRYIVGILKCWYVLRSVHTTLYSDLCFASCIHRYYKLKMGCMCMMLWVQMVALECSRTSVSKVSIP